MDSKLRYYIGLNSAGFHRLAYREWVLDGAESSTIICVHGLARNARDFDFLAEELAKAGHRVICPDIAGRGLSDWLKCSEDYGYDQYLSDITALIARLNVEHVDFIGTSMGGIIGMMLASKPNTPLRNLVINDVGPFIPASALERIAEYICLNPEFADLTELEIYLRKVLAPFGDLSNTQWLHMARHGSRKLPEGGYALVYDPAIGDIFAKQSTIKDVDLWNVWESITIPMLVLRGAQSDLLSIETAKTMAQKSDLVEIADCGHAPALMNREQSAIIERWLSNQ